MNDEIARWKSETDRAIAAALDEQTRAGAVLGPLAEELLTPLRDVSTGGKRVRALLLLAAHESCGGTQSHAATGVAAALELFQTAALVHDDVLDGSDTRRGRPATHRRVEALHDERGWHGDAAAFGEAGAVLAGDLALMCCQRALRDALTTLSAAVARSVSALFSDMADIVTLGQYADMRAAAAPLTALGDQEQEIRDVMRAKTASYTAEFPLALGAAIAGADAAAIAAMREAGLSLGHAFQLRDDLLGLTGSPAQTGKPAGDDVREGKRTLVMWRAWRGTDDEGRAVIASTLGDRTAADHDVERVLDVVRRTDAVAWSEAEIAASAASARATLVAQRPTPQGGAALEALITMAVDRTA
ncbi:polyprenyl synthetase family protein [Demequina aestuarii]|uniref:polyprenyl synthetase family protein n=1 Tax=Demequina aestuarii TaxID=327095 RepID=UPI0007853F35|nr:polyprenyl synthetase family protein [Demequina aestuarii]